MQWLALRGLGRESRHWGRFIESFQAKRSEQVTCLDLPGVGTECHRESPSKLSEIIEDLRSRWLQLKASEGESAPWGCISISLGGMLAMKWCEQYPEDFHALVTMNSSCRGLSPFHHRMRVGAFLRLFKLSLLSHLGAGERARQQGIFEETSNKPVTESSSTIDHWVQIAESSPVSFKNLLRQLIAAATCRDPEKISTPWMVLASTQDHLVNVECSRRISEKFNAPLIEHPWAGHDLPLDDPEWVAEQIHQFASSLSVGNFNRIRERS